MTKVKHSGNQTVAEHRQDTKPTLSAEVSAVSTKMNQVAVVLVYAATLLVNSAFGDNAKARIRRQFGMPMNGGPGMKSPGPFPISHGPMGSPRTMGSMPMTGSLQGPSTPFSGGGMSPSNVGAFHTCIKGELSCPQYCLMIDEYGCKSCPCGPANGMGGGSSGAHPAMGGGMSGGGMGGGGMSGGGMSGSLGGSTSSSCMTEHYCQKFCSSGYSMGPAGSDGCPTCSCGGGHSSVSAGGGSVGGGNGGGGGGYVIGGTTHVTGGSPQVVYVVQQPQQPRRCLAMEMCMSTCQYKVVLGSEDADGCQSCTCQNPSPVRYEYVQMVQPVHHQVECHVVKNCMASCIGGYYLGSTGSDGCPSCVCLTPEVNTVVQPIVNVVTCSRALRCQAGCYVGYRCGADGCPTCECIHPRVIGLQIEQITLTSAVTCSASFSCPQRCEYGYQCGHNGCPVCRCITPVSQSLPEIVVEPIEEKVIVDTCNGCGEEEVEPQIIPVVPAEPQVECGDCQTQTSLQSIISACMSTTRCVRQCGERSYTLAGQGPDGCPICTCQTSSGCSGQSCGERVILTTGTQCSGSSCGSSSGAGLYTILTSGSRVTSGTSTGGYFSSGSKGTASGPSYAGAPGGVNGSGLGAVSYASTCLGAQWRRDCPPICIKYDEPHCRRCTC